MDFRVDSKWESYNVVRSIVKAYRELDRRSSYTMTCDKVKDKTMGDFDAVKRKRKHEDMIEETVEVITMSIVTNLEEFVVKLFIMSIDENFRKRMAMNQDSEYVNDVMLYYAEFCKLLDHMEYEYNRTSFQNLFDIFVNNYHYLALNYFQSVQLFNITT